MDSEPIRIYTVYDLDGKSFYKGQDHEQASKIAESESSKGKYKEALIGIYELREERIRVEIRRTREGCRSTFLRRFDLTKNDLETITELTSQKV